MDSFEYLTVFVSIILGLGMTYLILGIGKLLSQKRNISFYWIHHLQIVSTFLIILNTWWITYSWVGIETLNFFHYLFLMCTPLIVVLASSLLFPIQMKEGRSLKEHYFSIYQPYYILVSLIWPLDIVDTFLKGTHRFAELGTAYLLISILSFAVIFTAAFIRRPWYHGFIQLYIISSLLISKLLFAPTLESLIR